eukprot:UN09641
MGNTLYSTIFSSISEYYRDTISFKQSIQSAYSQYLNLGFHEEFQTMSTLNSNGVVVSTADNQDLTPRVNNNNNNNSTNNNSDNSTSFNMQDLDATPGDADATLYSKPA